MDKKVLKNKAITDLIEDAQDGRVKKASVTAAEKAIEASKEAPKSVSPKTGYQYQGAFYSDFNDIPGARSKKEMLLAKGAIKKV